MLFGMTVFLHPVISVFVSVSIKALQFSRESYLSLPFSTVIDSKPEQPENLQLVVGQWIPVKMVEK